MDGSQENIFKTARKLAKGSPTSKGFHMRCFNECEESLVAFTAVNLLNGSLDT